jgi:hypothetical protein
VLIEFHHPYVPTIASIQYFFTLRNTPNANGKCGTFYAVVRLYRAQQLTGHGPTLKPIYKVDPTKYDESTHRHHHGLRCIDIACITDKVHRFVDYG